MLAERVSKLPVGSEWQYEVKLDGYRIQANKDGAKVRLLSRRGSDFTKRFKKVADAMAQLQVSSAVLDGEVVAVDEAGRPSFQVLQHRGVFPPGYQLVFYAFDLLALEGEDLKQRPLSERHTMLEELVADQRFSFLHRCAVTSRQLRS